MEMALTSPAGASVFGIPTMIFSVLIPVLGIGIFSYIIYRRMIPLFKGAKDPRFDQWPERLLNMLKYALAQYRQPRYRLAGVLHILLFAGFVILSLRSMTLVILGIFDNFVLPGLGGAVGSAYEVLKDIAGTIVFGTCIIAIIRRAFFKPKRYAVPAKYGKEHTAEAVFVLLLISTLMLSEALFEGSVAAAKMQKGYPTGIHIPGTLSALAAGFFTEKSQSTLQAVHLGAYFIHDLAFFFFLCFLPLGKHFHVITSFPNVYFMKLRKGVVKPVKWGIGEDALDQLESFGVKTYEDFTWKHMLDFYSCADCGRCSDNCPANAVGRPLSPRFISIKCRNHSFDTFSIIGKAPDPVPFIGGVLEEDEIWSCTTCGACEEECPLLIEYIDKIVDVRRGLVDEGRVPQSLQKPLGSLEKRGNPYGKMEKKRGDWAKDLGFVKVLGEKKSADMLYFVDSITSYDDRIQEIARATARILKGAGIDFGILGPAEMDSGHEVRRFGEEMLFLELKRQNTDAIRNGQVNGIVTADPHAFNALTNDYSDIKPVEHISQLMERSILSGKIRLKGIEDPNLVFTYHDPCYLGRHNGIYDAPRRVLDAVPGMRRVEMIRSKDRSFCCGGGGLMLFYEPTEETRMGKLRVEMAKEAGANVIVTACPFCMVNIEDAIKTSGLEGKMRAVDIAELIDQQMIQDQ
ncbi:MAG: (Fe-S)-binding protein [Pseudomonadota bacterium]